MKNSHASNVGLGLRISREKCKKMSLNSRTYCILYKHTYTRQKKEAVMLLHLSVKDFVIAEHIELEFDQGMTVITGETGAGKSIMLDALSLCIGARADANVVRHQCKQAEVTACFDISNIPEARQWLQSRELLD